MSDSYSVRPLDGAAGAGQVAGSFKEQQREQPDARQDYSVGPDFLLELSGRGRSEAQRLLQNKGDTAGDEEQGRQPDSGAADDNAQYKRNAFFSRAQAHNSEHDVVAPTAPRPRNATVAAIYQAVQDSVFPGTALAPWGTGISIIV